MAAAIAALGIGVALGAAPAATAADAPDQVAMTTIDDIAAGNYAAVTARFDPELQKRLSPKALQQVWDGYQRTFGAYQSHGGPEDTLRGDLTVVNVPLQMDRMPGQFRVKIHPDGTIAGVYFLREGVPVP
ncbi:MULTISPECIES: DUF3887 domain-containing protein [Mycolicibacterium]|uniref:DUF3887 domain-containing protein n=1 Tax=Mycolicibacterium TaxID=1866885 RepID=UPI000ECD4AFA|nr:MULTISPECIES: DUF3887 domain-containing protein [Mycolicibacterium]BBZ57107.1 hypothetical protein MPHO_40990 [Mycolicibacterium phocaicum]GCA97301.1 hypothetical protein NCCNTM_09360 [Mycolicibacterium sp. NCC-Tsukiji]